jgi:hypothetical protein
MIDKDRPFTPPFTKLVPIKNTSDRASSIIERAKEEILNSGIFASVNQMNFLEKLNREGGNKLMDSLEGSQVNLGNENNKKDNQFKNNHYDDHNLLNNQKLNDQINLDYDNNKIKTGSDQDKIDANLIYDHVLGCYYDPKTNMYYELKN